MRLLRVHLENFRSFRDVAIDLDEVTILIGPNDAGKSTIIEALRFLLNVEDPGSAPGHPWEDAGLPSKPPFDPEDPETYDFANGDVVVTGEVGDFTEAERDRLSAVIVDGVIRIGASLVEPDGADPIRYRAPCLVVPPGSSLTTGGEALLARHHPDRIHGGLHFVQFDDWDAVAGTVEGVRMMIAKPIVPAMVWLPGPDHPAPSARLLLQPFVDNVIEKAVDRLPSEVVSALGELTLDIEETLTTHLSPIVARYVPGALSAAVTTTDWWPTGVVRNMLQRNADSTEVFVRRNATYDWDPEDRGRPPGSDPESALGAGARRALALGVLELYGDADMWPVDQPVLLALEEPEAGLHSAAQRQVARSLRGLSTRSGVQTIIVTHSPVMIDAVPLSAIRLVRGEQDASVGQISRVYLPTDLAEVADLVGARPSDVLLADHFIVCEGVSDVSVLSHWARRLKLEVERPRTLFVPADGWNKSEVVAKLAKLIYPGSRVDVVVDGGPPTQDASHDFARLFGESVHLDRLSESEIEAYLPVQAIERWLVAQGADLDAPVSITVERPGPRAASEALNRLAKRSLGRSYRKSSDAGAIAALAREEEIPVEISELLIRLLA